MGLNVIARIDKGLYKLIKNKQMQIKKEVGVELSFTSASEILSNELRELRSKKK